MKAFSHLQEDLEQRKSAGTASTLCELSSAQKAEVQIGNQRCIQLSSNNYLGLTTHPKLIEAAAKAVQEWGVGTGSVRTIAGTFTLHEEFERRLAGFKKTEAALVFQSGFTANVGILTSLLGKEDVVISDELNHASIIDGIRLTKAGRRIYRHADIQDLERALQETKGARNRLVVTDGVFSMDGDIAPLPEIVDLCEHYGAWVMVDDAHASGVLGKQGRGTVDHFGLHGRVQIQVGTLSKAIGVLGGYVAGSQVVRDYLIQQARPFLFSTSHPPSVTAACMAALDVLESESHWMERLWTNTRYFKQRLQDLGFDTGQSQTPITPIIVSKEATALQMAAALREEGVFVQGIVYPTVPKGRARLRAIVTAEHRQEELDQSLRAFEKVGKRMGMI
jgi:glycine C-acetyltransferase